MYDRIWSIQSRVLLRLLQFDVIGGLVHADDMAYSEALIVSPKHYTDG